MKRQRLSSKAQVNDDKTMRRSPYEKESVGYFSDLTKRNEYENNCNLAVRIIKDGACRISVTGNIRVTTYTLRITNQLVGKAVLHEIHVSEKFIGRYVDEVFKVKGLNNPTRQVGILEVEPNVVPNPSSVANPSLFPVETKSATLRRMVTDQVVFNVWHKKQRKDVSISTVYGNTETNKYIINRGTKAHCPVILKLTVRNVLPVSDLYLKDVRLFMLTTSLEKIELKDPGVTKDPQRGESTLFYDYTFNLTAKNHTTKFRLEFHNGKRVNISETITVTSYSEGSFRSRIKNKIEYGYRPMISPVDKSEKKQKKQKKQKKKKKGEEEEEEGDIRKTDMNGVELGEEYYINVFK